MEADLAFGAPSHQCPPILPLLDRMETCCAIPQAHADKASPNPAWGLLALALFGS